MPRLPKLPDWYSWTALFALTIGSIAISIVVNINVSQRAIQSDHRARAEAAAQNHRAVCLVVATQESVSRQVTGDVGAAAAKAWHDLGILFRCY